MPSLRLFANCFLNPFQRNTGTSSELCARIELLHSNPACDNRMTLTLAAMSGASDDITHQSLNQPCMTLSKNEKVAAAFNGLPAEVITRIVALAKDPRECQKASEGYPDDRPANEDHPFYKSLRLTSKLFEQIATPFLFEVVVLWYHPESWATLNAIAGSRMASCVKTILLANLRRVNQCASMDEWRRATGFWQGLWDLRKQPPNGGPHSRLDYSKLDDCYARYQYWSEGEVAMDRYLQNDIAPTLRLHLLTNLERVQTVGHADLASIRVRANKEGYGYWDARDLTRREVESCISDFNFSPNEMPGNDWHLKLLTISQQHFGAVVPCLSLQHPWELDQKMPDLQLLLTGLRRLEISMLSCVDFNSYIGRPIQSPHPIELSSWTRSLDCLEELSVVGCHSVRRPYALRLLAAMHLPKIRTLSLQGVAIAHENLLVVLNQCWQTLSSSDRGSLDVDHR